MASAKGLHLTLVVSCVFNAFLCFTSILLNIITIQALRKTSSLPKTLITLLLSLAVSDLVVGLLVQPLYVAVLVMNIDENSNNTAYYSVYKAYLIQKKVLVLASHLGVLAFTFEFNWVFTIHCKPAAVSTLILRQQFEITFYHLTDKLQLLQSSTHRVSVKRKMNSNFCGKNSH